MTSANQRHQRHELKTWPRYFARILDGTKTFEARKDDGQAFAVGDVLWLREHTGARYTGRSIDKRVTYVFNADDDLGSLMLTEDTVIMGLGAVFCEVDPS